MGREQWFDGSRKHPPVVQNLKKKTRFKIIVNIQPTFRQVLS